jgi:hypothetical protein
VGVTEQIHIDLGALTDEQQERATWLSATLERVKHRASTPWSEIMEAMNFVEDMGFALPTASSFLVST